MAGFSLREGGGYRPRRPERELLHQVLSEHLESFLALTAADPGRPGLPHFVERELRRYLGCGVLASGFARVHCSSCGKDLLVAFSCKGRGFCPSCGGRRMAETAAHLVDRVFPDVAVRQWVISFPWRVRFLLARDPDLLCVVKRLVRCAILSWYCRRAGFCGGTDNQGGAVCYVQRFDSALNLNAHLHAPLLDGVYSVPSAQSKPQWHEADPLSDEDVDHVCRTIRAFGVLRVGAVLEDGIVLSLYRMEARHVLSVY